MYGARSMAAHHLNDRSRSSVALVERLRGDPGRLAHLCAIYLRLLQRKSVERHNATLRLLRQTLKLHLSDIDYSEYILANQHVVVVGPSDRISRYDKALQSVRTLLGQDGREPTHWEVSCFNLGNEVDRRELIATTLDCRCPALDSESSIIGRLLTAAEVSALASKIKSLDISTLISSQIAVRLTGSTLTPIFEEICVSSTDLQRALKAPVEGGSLCPLRQYLEASLDRPMIEYCAGVSKTPAAVPLSLNLALGTVANEAFQDGTRVPWIPPLVEIALVDVLAAPQHYRSVQTRLSQRRVDLVIDGIGLPDLVHLDISALDPPMIKIMWDDEATIPLPSEQECALRRAVSAIGANRVIMADVDGETPLTLALSFGIKQLQGKIINRLVAAKVSSR